MLARMSGNLVFGSLKVSCLLKALTALPNRLISVQNQLRLPLKEAVVEQPKIVAVKP
jgi:hypothetical protein